MVAMGLPRRPPGSRTQGGMPYRIARCSPSWSPGASRSLRDGPIWRKRSVEELASRRLHALGRFGQMASGQRPYMKDQRARRP
jgi:hypothetical protein